MEGEQLTEMISLALRSYCLRFFVQADQRCDSRQPIRPGNCTPLRHADSWISYPSSNQNVYIYFGGFSHRQRTLGYFLITPSLVCVQNLHYTVSIIIDIL